MRRRSLALAVIAFFLLSWVQAPAVSGESASPTADVTESIQDKALEHLSCRLLDENSFEVLNDGGVSAQITHVAYKDGQLEWVDVPDFVLISGERRTMEIQRKPYSAIGVLTSRGLIYPVDLAPSGSGESESEETVIEGTTEPDAPVTITVYSEPQVYKIYADNSGYFKLAISNLSPGTHTVVAVAGDANRNGRVDEGGWEGFEEREDTRPIERGQTVTFALPLTYHPFDVELSETFGSLTRGYEKITYSGRRTDTDPSEREVPVLDESGNQVYDEVQKSVFSHYTWEERVTKYFTTTTQLSVSNGEWVDTGKTYELWPLGSLPSLPSGYRWVKTGSGWISTFYKEQYNAVEYYKAQGYSVVSNYGTEEYQVWNPYHEWVPGHYVGGYDYKVDWKEWVPGYYVGGYDYRVDWTTTEWNPYHEWVPGHYETYTYYVREARTGVYYTQEARTGVYYTYEWRYIPYYPYFYRARVPHYYTYYVTVPHYYTYYVWVPRTGYRWVPGYWKGAYETKSHSETYDHYSDAYKKKTETGGSITPIWNPKDTWIPGHYEAHSETFNNYWEAYQKMRDTGGSMTPIWNPNHTWVAAHWEGAWETRTRQVLTGYTASKQVPYQVWVERSGPTKPEFSSGIRNIKEVYKITTTQVPRTRVETYYKVYEYGGTYYSYLPWGEKQTTVTATPRNGYTGEVRLEVEDGDGVEATLGSSVLSFASSASTTLSIRPKHASVHPVTVEAHDSTGKFVRTLTYELDASQPRLPSGSSWENPVGESEIVIPPTIISEKIVPISLDFSISVSPSTIDVYTNATHGLRSGIVYLWELNSDSIQISITNINRTDIGIVTVSIDVDGFWFEDIPKEIYLGSGTDRYSFSTKVETVSGKEALNFGTSTHTATVSVSGAGKVKTATFSIRHKAIGTGDFLL